MKLKYDGKVIGTIATNHSMSIEDAIELLEVNVDDYADYELFSMDWSGYDLSHEDAQKLGRITTRDEAGTHFTQIYDVEWLTKMETVGYIKINRPIHQTGIPYGQEEWTVEVTPEGIEAGEEMNWGEDSKEDFEEMIRDFKADHAEEMEDLVIDEITLEDGKWTATAHDAKTTYSLTDDGTGNIVINYIGTR